MQLLYTIQPGDTLAALAKRFHTTVEALASANNIKDPNKIYAGDTLMVPVLPGLWEALKKVWNWGAA